MLTPAFLPRPMPPGSSTAAAAMLFINSDRNAPAIITTHDQMQLASAADTQQDIADLIRDAGPLQRLGQDKDRDDRDHRRPLKNPKKPPAASKRPSHPSATTTSSATRSAGSRPIKTETRPRPRMTQVMIRLVVHRPKSLV